METTEPKVQPVPEHEPVIVLNQEAQYYLQQAGKWASFLGIMGFIGSGLILIVALFAGTLLSTISRFSPNPSPLTMMGPAIGVIYFIIAGIMFYINLNLYQFGIRIKSGIAFGDNRLLTSSFDKLRSFFKIKGIVLIVVISFYLLAIIAVVVAGVGAASMMR